MSLDTKTNKFAIVINIPKGVNINDFVSKCNDTLPTLFCEFYSILHDCDITENGEKKTPHLHIVAKSNNRVRLATIINKLADLLQCSTLVISCKKCVSFVGSIQYLIHKNDTNKYQYDIKSIYTNVPFEDLELLIHSDNDSITIDRLISIVKNASTLADIMREIGLSTYIGYRNVIKDLWQERMFL